MEPAGHRERRIRMARKVLIALPVVAVALVLTGCKSGHTAASPTHSASATAVRPPMSSPSPSATASNGNVPHAAKADLTVTYKASASAKPEVWTLRCDPTGGNHPQAATACTNLAVATAKGDPFAPTRVGVMCSMIYGGPETATLKGTYNSRAVSASFSRKNGCEVARWNKLARVLGPLVPLH